MGRRRKGKRRVGVDDEVKSQSTDDSRPRSREDQSTARSNNSASTYTATFTNDEYEIAFSHAPRLYLAPDPDMIGYNGEYDKNGDRSGYGTFLYANGDVYEGNWKKNLYNGKGRLVLENGDLYEGIWKDGKLHGKKCHIKFYNGVDYIGAMKHGKKLGFCRYISYTGETIDEGWWLKSGRYVGKTWSRRLFTFWFDCIGPMGGFPSFPDIIDDFKKRTVKFVREKRKEWQERREYKAAKRAARKAAKEAKEKEEAEQALQKKEKGWLGNGKDGTPNKRLTPLKGDGSDSASGNPSGKSVGTSVSNTPMKT